MLVAPDDDSFIRWANFVFRAAHFYFIIDRIRKVNMCVIAPMLTVKAAWPQAMGYHFLAQLGGGLFG